MDTTGGQIKRFIIDQCKKRGATTSAGNRNLICSVAETVAFPFGHHSGGKIVRGEGTSQCCVWGLDKTNRKFHFVC